MVYFNSQGNKEYFNLEGNPHRGGFAFVYPLDNGLAFKKYYMMRHDGRITKESFPILKSIDNPHFINLKDYYYVEDNPNIIAAYTYEYLKEDKTLLVDLPMDLFLDNLWELEKLITFFTENYVYLSDLKCDNVILNNGILTIIDPDQYRFFPSMFKELRGHNKLALIRLFRSLLLQSNSYEFEGYTLLVDDLFNKELKDKNITDEVFKKIKKYNNIRDYYFNNK